jgi:DNA-binding MarR family transcriptional regulator
MLDHARRRNHFLPNAIFEDPQWLMTLDLFIAGEEGRQVSVSSLCCASGVPPTTALRHIRYLQAQGIFERVSHPNDKRISLMRLADASRSQVTRYLSSIGSGPITGGKHSGPGASY